MMNATELAASEKVRLEKAFLQFLQRPETKFLLSMIPQADHAEAVETLLRVAFEAGSHQGYATALVSLLALTVPEKKGD